MSFSSRGARVGRRLGAAAAVLALGAGCGKKGPPLAPLDLAPAAPTGIEARRLGDRVYLTFRVPDASARGNGPYSIDHVDVFAMTVAPGTAVPPNRLLLDKPLTIGTIAVRVPDEEEGETAAGDRPADAAVPPAPGATTTFVETLASDDLLPTIFKQQKDTKDTKDAKDTKGTTAPAAPVGPPVLTRFYVVRGVTKGGRPGSPSTRVEVPLLAAPEPPQPGGSPSWDASSVTINWNPPPSRTDEAPGVAYNVYRATPDAASPAVPPAPLNSAPLSVTTFTSPGAAPDVEQCFVVRSVASVTAPAGAPASTAIAIESAPSAPICVTPKDTFPPAAPRSLAAVGSVGVVNLIWDANTEPDLAGYLVLRGEAAGGTLQPLMAEPIKDTRYADRTARPGVRYAYEVVAVDRAGNRSPVSNRVEEAAR